MDNSRLTNRRWTLMVLIMTISVLFQIYRVSAQSVTIDTKPAKVSYYRLPEQPLDPAYKTYSADINIPFNELSKTNLTKTSLVETYLKLDGYKQASGKGDVEITADVGSFTIWMESRSSNSSKYKDKTGHERVRFTYYIEVRYSMPVSVQVYSREGKRLLDEYTSSNSDTRTWTSPSYDDMSSLESYWRYERPSRMSKLQSDLLVEGLKSGNYLINKNFGYTLMTETLKFETIGKKKHPLYDDFSAQVDKLTSGISRLQADKSVDAVRSEIKPVLTFYRDQSSNFPSSSKDDLKLRHICLYNLAQAYFWTEDFDLADEAVKDILAKESKDKDARRLKEAIDNTRDALKRNNRKTRHQVTIGAKS